jgi:hypothetical protein
MPTRSRLLADTRIAWLGWVGGGLLTVTGCGPPGLGSVQLPKELKRSGSMGYGPSASKGTSPGLGPGEFRPAPPARTQSTQRAVRPTGSPRR